MLPLRVDPSSPTPLWSQIEDRLRRLVAQGEIGPGQAVPSVRDLARDLGINPATVARAYQELAGEGLLETRRGDGTYVAGQSQTRQKRIRRDALRADAAAFAGAAQRLGASQDEAVAALGEAWADLGSTQRRRA